MTEHGDAFTWDVYTGGHEWASGPARGGQSHRRLALTPPAPGKSHASLIKPHCPLAEHTGLFRTFADLGRTADDIVAFADEYGALGRRAASLFKAEPGRPARPRGPVLVGETERDWKEEIVALREAVGLWIDIQANDGPALSRRVSWEKDAGGRDWVRYDSAPELETGDAVDRSEERVKEVIAGKNHYEELLEGMEPGDPFLPAQRYLQRVINRRLHETVKPWVLWDDERGRLVLHYIPDSLRGAMWLQFAEALHGDRTYRRCQECARWFDDSPLAGRCDRVFCSQACRSKAYRGRQDRARQMKTEGKSFRAIAKELDSDVKIVKRWITGVKEE